jgi:hypothetical protein
VSSLALPDFGTIPAICSIHQTKAKGNIDWAKFAVSRFIFAQNRVYFAIARAGKSRVLRYVFPKIHKSWDFIYFFLVISRDAISV